MAQSSDPKIDKEGAPPPEVDANLAATGEFPHQPPEPEDDSSLPGGDRKDRPSPQWNHPNAGGQSGSFRRMY